VMMAGRPRQQERHQVHLPIGHPVPAFVLRATRKVSTIMLRRIIGQERGRWQIK
jgi:hypothetical protein